MHVEQKECALRLRCNLKVTVAIFLIIVLFAGCAGRRAYSSRPKVIEKPLARLGYTIQVGAFSDVENAARLTDQLQARGLDATYFVARAGLYKVRFGNYPSKAIARQKAEGLKSSGAIDEFYIVNPDEYAVARQTKFGDMYIREELIKTAESFVGVPYLWGGTSPNTGFDCSGLSMTVYQLNGLDLPRSSREQYETGTPVERSDLLKGDLVFFATSGRDKVAHVGINDGDGRFIHAAGRGKNIRADYLSSSYYKKRYLGGRAYI
ncbi:MAG: NlpC/P60 family protein [Syntrophales bacterium LBB04]|nr:NlpC/P60 family protein [Syntrophales bacterium LBB04]